MKASRKKVRGGGGGGGGGHRQEEVVGDGPGWTRPDAAFRLCLFSGETETPAGRLALKQPFTIESDAHLKRGKYMLNKDKRVSFLSWKAGKWA